MQHMKNSLPKPLLTFCLMVLILMSLSKQSISGQADKINETIDNAIAEKDSERGTKPQPLTIVRGKPHSKERWIEASRPLGSVQIIAASAQNGIDCQKVIFERAAALPVRYEPKPGDTFRVDLEQVCWIGLRNGSEARSVVFRMGEQMARIAVTSVSDLVTGTTLTPKEQLRIPLRSMRSNGLPVSLEVIWEDKIKTATAADADKITIEFFSSKGP